MPRGRRRLGGDALAQEQRRVEDGDRAVAEVSLGAPRHEVRCDAVHEHGAQNVVIFAGHSDGVGAEVQQQLLQQILLVLSVTHSIAIEWV